MKRRSKLLLVLLGLFAAVAAFVLLRPAREIKVRIINTGSAPLINLRVEVTGASYPLDNLQPGEHRLVKVEPTYESDIVLRYFLPGSHEIDKRISVFFQPNYAGLIELDVTGDNVTIRSNRIAWRPL